MQDEGFLVDADVLRDLGADFKRQIQRLTEEIALEAGRMALHAGIDMEAPRPFGFTDDLLRAVERGEADMAEIDQAVYRILLGKFRLGLFENP